MGSNGLVNVVDTRTVGDLPPLPHPVPQGPGVKFQGGVRLFDESWVGDTGVNATQATTENSTLTVDPGATQYSAVAECGRDVS